MDNIKLPFGYGGDSVPSTTDNVTPDNIIAENTTNTTENKNIPELTYDSGITGNAVQTNQTPAMPDESITQAQNILNNYDSLDIKPRKRDGINKKWIILFAAGVLCALLIAGSIAIRKYGAFLIRSHHTAESAASTYVTSVINNKSTSGLFYDKKDDVKLMLNPAFTTEYAENIQTKIIYNPDMDKNQMLNTIEAKYGINKESIEDEQTVEVNSDIDQINSVYVLTYAYEGKYYVFDAYLVNDEQDTPQVTDSDTSSIDLTTGSSTPSDIATKQDAEADTTKATESDTTEVVTVSTEGDTESDYYIEDGYARFGSDSVGYVTLPDYFSDSSDDIAPVDGSEGIAFKDKENNEVYLIKYSKEMSEDNSLKITAESMTSGVCGSGTEVKVNTSNNGVLRNSYVGEVTLDDGKFVKVYTFCGEDDCYRSVIFLCGDEGEFEKYYNSYTLDCGVKELKE